MVFGTQQLRNELEGVQAERDFFQAKYLEQISELSALNEALRTSRREVSRLRQEIIQVSTFHDSGSTTRDSSLSPSSPVRNHHVRALVRLEEEPSGGGEEDTTDDDEKKDENGDEPSGMNDYYDRTLSNQSYLKNRLMHAASDDASSLTNDEEAGCYPEDDVSDDEEDVDENTAIRESASKLLQWVNHRDASHR